MGGLGLSWPSKDAHEIAPALFVFFFAIICCMAEFLDSIFKRKTRGSSSSSESGVSTPKEKRICKTPSEPPDEINMALEMAEDLASKIQLVLHKLSSLENMVEGVLKKFNTLESSVKSIEGEIATLNAKTNAVEKSVGAMDNSLKFLNSEIEELKSKANESERKIKSLNDRILYQDVYSRRENLRFFNIPESTDPTQENAKELIYRYMEREIEVDRARDIEFQRVHRIGVKKSGSPRPIIARFLRFPDRERVFKRAMEVKDEIEVRVYADYPKEIQERRRKLWPRLKQAREDGKRAFFDKKEPDKLIVDGHLVI